MRIFGVVSFVLAGLCLAGCSSTSGVDALQMPSNETTSSVVRPSAPVTKAVKTADAAMTVETVSMAGAARIRPPASLPGDQNARVDEDNARPGGENSRLDVENSRPFGLAEEETVAFPAPDLPDTVEPPVEAAALVSPPKRLSRAAPAMLAGPVTRYAFRDAKPINFGRASPRHLAVHGVDVSRWQGNINWQKLRAQGANFAYIKATDGGDHLDPMFMKNWRGADAAGLKRGAYHFFYWCRTAGEQADWFIRNVPRVQGALPPVIDVEWNGESSCKRRPSRQKVLEKMQVFMDKLERHYGQRPIIYTSPDFYRDNLRGAFLDYPFWLRAVAAHPSKVYPGRNWLFWQYSGSGLSHGVSGRIDLNVFHGDERQWRRWLGGGEVVADAN
ncbi:MAG: muramidase [Mesorhizobium sp.]|uniref:glycoside hydrolase family 25 protein n=7 Tax=Mesorhizobium TaxID=68287 RepID=UPI000F765635|nr:MULTISPECIES: GH25 family lysozyme [unclassified Mesorhizobium]TGV88348.1 muramidase [Mesorhizobium sp. M00.F.Ca.ET.158.01.1.1]AZO62785.1 muramidase [Mesorhizobium sp. M1A.F.Ca.IN.022.06.1.1]MCT2577811.1 glycoside hydrolase family 25 protein [Mesorhizobium sp. P13.3]MDF3166749.1 GH25 family lysozyme [Mesorhizobium sp. P16.1]MDF3180898.1 GH25 family lysozyme [Mesorhizobium sp. P17.1]